VTRRAAIAVVLVLGLACLAAGVPVWIRTSGTTALDAAVAVAVTGTQAAPAVSAAALVLLAAGAAIGLVGRFGRWVVVAAVAGCGALVASSAVAVIADPAPIAASMVAEATGVASLASPATLTFAPYAVAALGVALVLVGVWIAWSSRAWAARGSARHELAGAPAAAAPDDDQAAWDALTGGNDPT